MKPLWKSKLLPESKARGKKLQHAKYYCGPDALLLHMVESMINDVATYLLKDVS